MHCVWTKQCCSCELPAGLSECFGIGLSVHAFFFGGSDVCEWIYLFIDVCVLCLSHSSGLVWPVCKHVCTRAATSLQEWVGNRNAARGGSLPSDAEANGTCRLEQSLRVLLMISQYNGMWLFFTCFEELNHNLPVAYVLFDLINMIK